MTSHRFNVALREFQPWLASLKDQAEEGDCLLMLLSHHRELINFLAANYGTMFFRGDAGPIGARQFGWRDNELAAAAEIVARGWE